LSFNLTYKYFLKFENDPITGSAPIFSFVEATSKKNDILRNSDVITYTKVFYDQCAKLEPAMTSMKNDVIF